MVIRRYMVFAYDMYYPSGGWSDYQASFDEFDDAVTMANSIREGRHAGFDVASIIDTVSGQEFSSFYDYKSHNENEYYEHDKGLVLGSRGHKRKYQNAGSWRNCEND